MPDPSETSQKARWLEFFRRIRQLAAQLDALETRAETDAEKDRE